MPTSQTIRRYGRISRQSRIENFVEIPLFRTPLTDDIRELNKQSVWNITAGVLDNTGKIKSNFDYSKYTASYNITEPLRDIAFVRGFNLKDYFFHITTTGNNKLYVRNHTDGNITSFTYSVHDDNYTVISNAFGNIYITNDLEYPKLYDIQANTLSTIPGTNDAFDYSGNVTIQKAKVVKFYSNYLILMNTEEKTNPSGPVNRRKNRLRTSQLGNPGMWKNNADGTGSIFINDFNDSEEILGGESFDRYFIVFTSENIYRLNFVGGSLLFTIDKISDTQVSGQLLSPLSTTVVSDGLYFMTSEGLFKTDGARILGITAMRRKYWEDNIIKDGIAWKLEWNALYDSFMITVYKNNNTTEIYGFNPVLNSLYKIISISNANRYPVSALYSAPNENNNKMLIGIRGATTTDMYVVNNIFNGEVRCNKVIDFNNQFLKRWKQIIIECDSIGAMSYIKYKDYDLDSNFTSFSFSTNRFRQDFNKIARRLQIELNLNATNAASVILSYLSYSIAQIGGIEK